MEENMQHFQSIMLLHTRLHIHDICTHIVMCCIHVYTIKHIHLQFYVKALAHLAVLPSCQKSPARDAAGVDVAADVAAGVLKPLEAEFSLSARLNFLKFLSHYSGTISFTQSRLISVLISSEKYLGATSRIKFEGSKPSPGNRKINLAFVTFLFPHDYCQLNRQP